MSEVKEKTGKKFTKSEHDKIVEFVIDEQRRRKSNRKDREKQWKEIDRQLRMEPDIKSKRQNGKVIPHKAWMPEMELPNQSTALEILTSDAIRMMFPDQGDWFNMHTNASRELLERFSSNTDFVINDELEAEALITQDNIDDYAAGFVKHGLRQFDHRGTWDLINTDAFKYGNGIGKARIAKKPVFIHRSKGTTNNSVKIPILAPVSIKDVLLDEMENAMMADGTVLGPAQIFHQFKKLEDVLLAAKKGSKDPDDEDGGWMPDVIEGLEADKNGNIEYIEYEGDMIVPISGGKSEFLPSIIATVAIGKVTTKTESSGLIRLRFRKSPYSSYINVPYQMENINDPYATSPLMKGMPIQKAASEALNRFMQSAILNTEPVVRYSKDDIALTAQGGPQIYPGAMWSSEEGIDVINIGDPGALQNAYGALLSQYSDVTGINAPRLGAQTVSHTTAFAKDQEIERGTVRTVDYVRMATHGPMTRWMYMFYDMARETLGSRTEEIFIDKFNGFVQVTQDLLPKEAFFEVTASNGPADSAAKQQQQQQALLTAIQINQLAVQQGISQPLNYDAITQKLLTQGGITDVDIFGVPASGTEGAPELPATDQSAEGLGTAPAAVQGITQALTGL